jgi:hypothetical protein
MKYIFQNDEVTSISYAIKYRIYLSHCQILAAKYCECETMHKQEEWRMEEFDS